MDRLTIERKNQPKGALTPFSEEELLHIKNADVGELYTRLQEYENTGLTPDQIIEIVDDIKILNPILEKYLETIMKESTCEKAGRCLFGADCPNGYIPTNEYYGCFDAGRYDKTIENVPQEIYDLVKRDLLRRRRFGK